MIYKVLLALSCTVTLSFSLELDDFNASNESLTLKSVVAISLQNDAWLVGNRYRQRAIEQSSIAAGTYADPKITIATANLPTDTFDVHQEAMTQLSVGVSQLFPRGDSLEIKKEQLRLMASQYPFQREERKSKLTLQISQLWLEAYKAQESIALIEKNRSLFKELADIVESSYATMVGKTRQQDILRAQLELTKLDERLSILGQQKEMATSRLLEWFYNSSESADEESHIETPTFILSRKLPNIAMLHQEYFQYKESSQELLDAFKNHPSVKSIEQNVKAASKGMLLAKEMYKPQFGVNASYSYRDDDLAGRQRADLLSVGVSFDMPLFSENKQDRELNAEVLKTKSLQSEKVLQLRKLLSSFKTIKANLSRLKEREALYKKTLLPQIKELTEASVRAYSSDDGSFSDLVRARISQLNAEIDLLNISVEIEKNIVAYNYLFAESAEDMLKSREGTN